jgi:hypothetical protein
LQKNLDKLIIHAIIGGSMNQLLDLQLFEVSVVDNGANGLADIVLYKRKEEVGMPRTKKEVESVEKAEEVVVEQEKLAQQSDVSTEEEKPMELEVEIVEDGCGSDKKTEKSLESPVVELNLSVDNVSKVLQELDELRKRHIEAEAQIAKLQSEKKEAEWISKSSEIVFDTPETIGKLLHSVDALDTSIADSLFSMLKAASAQVKEGKLFSEIGKSGDTKISAYDKLTKIADEIRKAQNLTEAKAFTKACELNPTLVAEYRQGL